MIAFSTFALPRRPANLGARALLLLVLAGTAVSPAFAQREVRHLNALSATGGITSTGKYYAGSYGRFLTDKMRFEVAGTLEQGPRKDSRSGEGQPRYRGYELALGLAPRLLHVGEVFYLRLPFQVRTRYERLPPTGPAQKDGFTVGPSLGLAGEVYLNDRLSLSGEARQVWYPVGNPLNSLPRFFGGGVTLYLGQ